jgi:hypothetical protein
VASSFATRSDRHFISHITTKEKRRISGAQSFQQETEQDLLDLGFLELHVLARNGIILLHGEFFRFGAGILLRHIEIAGVGSGLQFNLNYVAFGHNGLQYGICGR